MKRPQKFPRAVAAVTSVMTVAYLAVGSVGYYRLGSHFDLTKPLTSILPQDAWLMAANVGLLAHCIVAYMVRLPCFCCACTLEGYMGCFRVPMLFTSQWHCQVISRYSNASALVSLN